MQIGVVFPQTEIGADVADVRRYAETVESLGYRHLLTYDHVLGADPAVHEGWDRSYDVNTTFHEPLVLFGFLAAFTSLELVTGIIVLPQRQTALVAKQAAQIDLLGRTAQVRHRDRVEQRRVRSARQRLQQPRSEERGAGRAAATTLDRAVRHVRGPLGAGAWCGNQPPARAATHPGVVRGAVRACLPEGRTGG